MCKYPVKEFSTHDLQGKNSVTQQTSLELFLIASSAKLSRMAALLTAVALLSIISNALAAPAPSQSTAPATGPVIYKLVDASGRITYTNSPTKGATKVELDPITVIPSSPAGMLGGGQAGAPASASAVSGSAQSLAAPALIPVGVAATIAKPEAPMLPLMPMASASAQPTFAASARAPIVQPATAIVTPVPALSVPRVPPTPTRPAAQIAEPMAEPPASSTYKLPVVKLSPRDAAPGDIGIRPAADTPLLPAVAAPAAVSVAPPAPVTMAVANIRDLELPAPVKPSLQTTLPAPKFEKEEQLLATLKAQLAEQQNRSASFRAMRARLPTIIDQSDAAKAAIQNDIKAQVEQHFERIRSLQDQITQREQSLAALRQ
jgi:hypothetical protein